MELTLNAEVRVEKGTGAAHRLRRQGLIPAVIYQKGGTECLMLSQHDTERLVSHAGTGRLVTLAIKSGKKTANSPVLIKEVQRNPVRGDIIHIDFHTVALDQPITTHVPMHLVGEDRRTNDGAIIEAFLREMELSCLPKNIPENVPVDVSQLAMGQSIHVRDLTPSEGIKFLTPPDELVVMAAAPTVAKEAEEGEEEAGAPTEETAAAPAGEE